MLWFDFGTFLFLESPKIPQTCFCTGSSICPRKLHPVLRAERAEKDPFATGQKNFFFGCLMNVILGVVK